MSAKTYFNVRRNMIDLSTGLSSDVGKQSAMHYNSLEDSQRLLEEFEKNMRMGTFGEMIKQSNSQKMQLVFEDYVRTNEENWKRWQTLRRKELQTSLDLYANEKILEYLKELVKLQV